MRKLVYRPAALADLDGIYDYIEPENPRRAASFVKDIRDRCRNLCTHPELGPAREDLGTGIRILPTAIIEKEAFRVLFAVGGGFDQLEASGVSGVASARANAEAYLGAILSLLEIPTVSSN